MKWRCVEFYLATLLRGSLRPGRRRLHLPTALPPELEPNHLLERMQLDKKASARGLRFILWEGPGTARIVADVPGDAVLETLREG